MEVNVPRLASTEAGNEGHQNICAQPPEPLAIGISSSSCLNYIAMCLACLPVGSLNPALW